MFDNKTLAALLALASGHAAVAADPVTTGETVVVTATRSAIPLSRVLADVTVLGREEIEQSGSLTLPELLSRQPGVEAYSNGGEGKSSSLMLRGASAKQTVVLIDGMRIVSGSSGTTSLENLNLDAIERIEILRGPASSLYGADAIGGVVQIFTKRGSGTPALSANVGAGAEGKRVIGAGLFGKADRTAFNLAFNHNRTDGISARSNRLSTYNPDRDGYENTTYTASVQHELAAGHGLNLTAFQSESRSEYDQSSKKQDESKSRLGGQSLELKNRLGERWNSSLRYSYSTDKSLNFTNGNFSTASSYFETRQNEWQWQNDLNLDAAGQLALGLVNTEQHVLSSTAFSQTRRRVNAAFAGYQGEFGAHRLQGSVRHDDNSQFGGHTTGQIGYGFVPAAGWLLRVAYGTAFRAPTFNDLYWPDATYTGNPRLKPEEAHNRELALRWQQGGSKFQLTVFDNELDYLILALSSGIVNVDKARIIGQTLEVSTVLGGVNLAANITSQRARDEKTGNTLQYRSKLHGGITASVALDRTTLNAELRAAGKRPAKADNSEYLAGYGIVNLGADYQLDKQWTLNAKLSNVGDKRYQTVKDYNQPGRGWFVGVRYAQ
ncbi:TonB-dependent receptor domain-containing protein [Vogesella indigofera]|uniref:TonB-dependent receptor domain-containing protein n=1 Tax=Vogesella indigofera TaxID=45465 RepID=UPI00234E40A4|nr:TonB-dependent receptor [Vogesella indigofera]MDC7709202.1 TonB-dependent receptor [Vogesella indigofera]